MGVSILRRKWSLTDTRGFYLNWQVQLATHYSWVSLGNSYWVWVSKILRRGWGFYLDFIHQGRLELQMWIASTIFIYTLEVFPLVMLEFSFNEVWLWIQPGYEGVYLWRELLVLGCNLEGLWISGDYQSLYPHQNPVEGLQAFLLAEGLLRRGLMWGPLVVNFGTLGGKVWVEEFDSL